MFHLLVELAGAPAVAGAGEPAEVAEVVEPAEVAGAAATVGRMDLCCSDFSSWAAIWDANSFTTFLFPVQPPLPLPLVRQQELEFSLQHLV